MRTTNTLLEPSFLVLIEAIERAADLPEQRRRHWVCSLRQTGKWLDRPPGTIPARWNAVRFSVGQLHHARVGVTAALCWYAKAHDMPQRGVPLSAEWATFCDAIDDRRRERRLYSLVHYCSGRGVAPSAVDDEDLR
jgi:hypothetical protein